MQKLFTTFLLCCLNLYFIKNLSMETQRSRNEKYQYNIDTDENNNNNNNIGENLIQMPYPTVKNNISIFMAEQKDQVLNLLLLKSHRNFDNSSIYLNGNRVNHFLTSQKLQNSNKKNNNLSTNEKNELLKNLNAEINMSLLLNSTKLSN